jgi:hypothetical protein
MNRNFTQRRGVRRGDEGVFYCATQEREIAVVQNSGGPKGQDNLAKGVAKFDVSRMSGALEIERTK